MNIQTTVVPLGEHSKQQAQIITVFCNSLNELQKLMTPDNKPDYGKQAAGLRELLNDLNNADYAALSSQDHDILRTCVKQRHDAVLLDSWNTEIDEAEMYEKPLEHINDLFKKLVSFRTDNDINEQKIDEVKKKAREEYHRLFRQKVIILSTEKLYSILMQAHPGLNLSCLIVNLYERHYIVR